ncbi:MAG: NifB/NifX family molybdenum-iron cluster-binding protein [Candidatus Bathyarchaeia archaeon]
MKVIVPIERYEGLKSIVAQHFGRAPFFAVVEVRRDGGVEAVHAVENTGEHLGGRVSVEELIGNLKPDALIVKGMGPRGLNAFQSRGVAVFTGDVATLEGAVQAYARGQLRGLTEPCKEARHRF